MGYRSGPEVPIIPSGKRNVEVWQMSRMPNRIVMAALTIIRAGSIDHVPTMRKIQRN
jgi:hypothetical protein